MLFIFLLEFPWISFLRDVRFGHVFIFQVFGESLRLTTDYLSIDEKVVIAQSKAELVEVESSRLRKDLESMDQAMKSKEKVDKLKKALQVEKKLVTQKDDELQAALLHIFEARDGVIAQFQESEHYSDLLFT